MPEAALARELNLDYATISLVVNAAAGVGTDQITMEKITMELKTGMKKIEKLFGQLIVLLSNK